MLSPLLRRNPERRLYTLAALVALMVVFAGFALFIWWRLVKDDYRRGLEEDLDDDAGPDTPPSSPTSEQLQQKVKP